MVKPRRAQFTCYEISHLPPNPSSRRRRFALEGHPQPPRPPREGARLPHPPCLRPARVTVICLIRWCSASSPDASHRSRPRFLVKAEGSSDGLIMCTIVYHGSQPITIYTHTQDRYSSRNFPSALAYVNGYTVVIDLVRGAINLYRTTKEGITCKLTS